MNVKHIGFTGTRDGMSPKQKEIVGNLLKACGGTVLHHGDCIGADFEAHQLAVAHGYLIEIHPPDNPKLRAYASPYDVMHTPRPYLERNKDIVLKSSLVIATPSGENEILRGSGTWQCIRLTHKTHTKLVIVYPYGYIKNFNGSRIDW